MIIGDNGQQPAFAARSQHPGIMVERSLREHAGFWLDARPFDAETIAVEPDHLRDVEVFFIAMIAVAGVAGRLLEDRVRQVFEQPAIGIDVVAFALVRGNGGAPQEILGQLARNGGESRGSTDERCRRQSRQCFAPRRHPVPFRSLARASQVAMKPAAMKRAMRSLTASKSSDLQRPPDSLSIRPVRPSVSISAPETKW